MKIPTKNQLHKPKAKANRSWWQQLRVKLLAMDISFGEKADLEHFLENLNLLSISDVSIITALTSIQESVKSARIKRKIENIKTDVDAGHPLWKSLERTRLFPPHLVSLIRIGEETGELARNLKIVAQQAHKEQVFRSSMATAMMYPALLIGMTLVLGTGVTWFILPRITDVFNQLNTEVPTITQWVINFGEFIQIWGHIAVPVFLVTIVLLIYFVFFNTKTRFIGQYLLFSVPGIQRLIKEVELARFGFLFGSMLKAQLPILEAAQSLGKAMTFPQYRSLAKQIQTGIERGDSFADVFRRNPLSNNVLPKPIQQIIISAEQSGNLADALLTIGEQYQERSSNTVKNISVIIEPVLLIFVGFGVLVLALAVILPIYNLVSTVQNQTENPTAQSAPTPVKIDSTRSAPIILVAPEHTIAKDSEAKEQDQVTTGQFQVVDSIDFLRVRSQPTTSSNERGRLTPLQFIDTLNEQNGWYEIVFEGQAGWVSGQYLTPISDE